MNALLAANLRALALHDPALAAAVRAASPDPDRAFVASGTGAVVPVRRDGPALPPCALPRKATVDAVRAGYPRSREVTPRRDP